MKEQLLKIASYGIPPGTSPDQVEQTKLVNLISLLGVPISATYVLLFSMTGHAALVFAFAGGMVVFGAPVFLNKWFGLPVGRTFIVIMASVVFASVTIIAGREAGFYLGFLVICMPPI